MPDWRPRLTGTHHRAFDQLFAQLGTIRCSEEGHCRSARGLRLVLDYEGLYASRSPTPTATHALARTAPCTPETHSKLHP